VHSHGSYIYITLINYGFVRVNRTYDDGVKIILLCYLILTVYSAKWSNYIQFNCMT
jgi:hypothetical protein